MAILPFYGATHPDLFAIERSAMDRPGKVIDRLDDLLPHGLVADIGAGDGFTAARLTVADRTVLAVEPAAGMIDRSRDLPWIRADAETLPFSDESLDAVYATWAYFFSRGFDPSQGIAEAVRTLRPDGRIVIVDNAGGDEFCALTSHDISADLSYWSTRGFTVEVIETVFEFETLEEADRLLEFYFGAPDPSRRTRFSYRVMLAVADRKTANGSLI